MNDESLRDTNEMPTRRLPKINQSARSDASQPAFSETPGEAVSLESQPLAHSQSIAPEPDWGAPFTTMPTPPPMPPVGPPADAEPSRGPALSKMTSRLGCGARLAILSALLLAGLALASNLILILALLRIQTAAIVGLDGAIAQVEQVCGPDAAPIIFPISQTIHFKGDIALPGGMNFPFKGNIPIRTTVRIAVPGLPGSPTIEVPINTVVPVDTQVPLPDGMRFPIDTVVPIRQDMPIDLCVEGGPARGFLEQTLQSLKGIRQNLLFVLNP
jgi:hypothetical protein